MLISINHPGKSKFSRYLKSYLPFWQKKKIGFYGNFGHGDLGDDASFTVARDFLGEDILPISKRCYAFNPHILKAFLIGGGGILRWESPYIPRRILTKKKWNFPVILFSAGINCDYNREFTKETKDKIKRLCEACDYLTVRDKISLKFLNNLGFNNVSLLPHLELALKEKFKNFGFNKERSTVGIVLTPHSTFTTHLFAKIRDIFTQFTDYLTDEDKDVFYIPFEKKISENIREGELIQGIMKKIKNKNRVNLLDGNMEPEEILYFIKNFCDSMVCMRLHSAVFSINTGLPFLCVSYNLTHRGFLEMLDATDLELSIFDNFSFDAIVDKFEYVSNNYSILKEKILNKREMLKSMIDKEISYIKSIL